MTVKQEFEGLPPVQSEIREISGTPEGVLAAPPGFVVRLGGVGGALYQKATKPNYDTGWKRLVAVYYFNTLTELIAYPHYADGDMAITLGSAAAWDFGRGMGGFIFDADDATASDNATAATHVRPSGIASDATAGRWRKYDEAWQGA